MSEIYALIQGAERAVDQQRFELAQALAAIAQARVLADIANALRDDDGSLDSLAQRLRHLEVTVNALHRKVTVNALHRKAWPGDWEAEN